MTSQERAFQEFADFAAQLKGDEKSEAQTFLFHLLEAFGHHPNTLPEGARFEFRVRRSGDTTTFARLRLAAGSQADLNTAGRQLREQMELRGSPTHQFLSPRRPTSLAHCHSCATRIPSLALRDNNRATTVSACDSTERDHLLAKEPQSGEVIFPYLNCDELRSGAHEAPRFIIDFGNRSLDESLRYKLAFARVQKLVLPKWQANAAVEREKTGKATGEHQNRLKTWWLLKRPREQMLAAIGRCQRYIVCARVTKRPVFEFLSPQIRPDSSLTVFAFADDYSFGILQSGIHWAWFTARCSTLTARFRYTSDTVFDTFPWPQFEMSREAAKGGKRKAFAAFAPSRDILQTIRTVAGAARALRALRREIMAANSWSLRDLYRTLEIPGKNRLRDAHAAIDTAVRDAYGMKPDEDILAFLLKLNLDLAAQEAQGKAITPPGLPSWYPNHQELVTADCIRPSGVPTLEPPKHALPRPPAPSPAEGLSTHY